MTTETKEWYAPPAGTRVIYEFQEGVVKDVVNGRVHSVRYSCFETSGSNLTVFPATEENIIIAKRIASREDIIREISRSANFNWPDIHGTICEWSHEVFRGETPLAEVMQRLDALDAEVTALMGISSQFGFKLLRPR